jgi:alpha-N-arabinofuranosidase
MSSYAPLLANISQVTGDSEERSMQWAVNLIGYDALKAYGTPSYYVQQMFAQNKGDIVLDSSGVDMPQVTDPDGKTRPSLYWDVTCESSTGHIKLKLVNRSGKAQPVRVALDGVKSVAATGLLTELSSADPDAGNDIDAPERIAPRTTRVPGLSRLFTRIAPPYSVSVLDFGASCPADLKRP